MVISKRLWTKAQSDLLIRGRKWNASDWTASDDRVRGGKSESHLEIKSSASVAKFKGTLDIKTLGGAGFASQRTTGDERSWDLSKYDGIELKIVKADCESITAPTAVVHSELTSSC